MAENRFNFRHVAQRVGIPLTNENGWAIGHVLSRMATERGVSVDRRLSEKTDPDPTVSAPHCICHYPMEMYADACDRVVALWEDKTRQLSLDL